MDYLPRYTQIEVIKFESFRTGIVMCTRRLQFLAAEAQNLSLVLILHTACSDFAAAAVTRCVAFSIGHLKFPLKFCRPKFYVTLLVTTLPSL
jgi:hypothetical protein